MAITLARCIHIGPSGAFPISAANASNMIMDADTEKIAYKYIPGTTSAITDIDLAIVIAGTVSDTNFQIEVQTDDADKPSGTVLGAATAEFAGPASGGFIGLKSLVTNTGNLTVNTPVWIVLYRSSGESLSATDSVGARIYNNSLTTYYCGFNRGRHHNGTDWTTTAVTSAGLVIVVKHADGSYAGNISNSSVGNSSAADIYSTNKQGIRMKFGSQIIIRGVTYQLAKAGAPNDLTFTVYEGSVSKYSDTILASSIVTGIANNMYFTSPVLLASNTNIYIILSQAGVADTDDYDIRVLTVGSTYLEAAENADFRFVYGTNSDPTLLTVSTTELPILTPLIDNPVVDLDEAAGGAGALLGGKLIR